MRRLFPVSLLALVLVLLAVVPATSQFCMVGGQYTSSPSIMKTCAFGLVNLNITSWSFLVNGSTITVNANSGHFNPLHGTINCQTGAFTASRFIAGSCNETYTLTGQLQSTTSWTGTFDAIYSGSQCNPAGCVSQSWNISASHVPTGVDGSVPPVTARIDVGPNPWNQATNLRVHLDSRQFTRVSIRDIRGREVATIVHGAWLDRGVYAYQWNGRIHSGERAPSGIYFVHLRTSAVERVAKLLVLN